MLPISTALLLAAALTTLEFLSPLVSNAEPIVITKPIDASSPSQAPQPTPTPTTWIEVLSYNWGS
jgi:hypothetical protein